MTKGQPWGDGHIAILERTASFSAESQSPRAARRLLREVMTEAGQPEGSDLGELAMSEVVTTAVLHAHTSIDVTSRRRWRSAARRATLIHPSITDPAVMSDTSTRGCRAG